MSQNQNIDGAERDEGPYERPEPRLANTLRVERNYVPDRKAMLVALRVVMGLPRTLPGRGQERRT